MQPHLLACVYSIPAASSCLCSPNLPFLWAIGSMPETAVLSCLRHGPEVLHKLEAHGNKIELAIGVCLPVSCRICCLLPVLLLSSWWGKKKWTKIKKKRRLFLFPPGIPKTGRKRHLILATAKNLSWGIALCRCKCRSAGIPRRKVNINVQVVKTILLIHYFIWNTYLLQGTILLAKTVMTQAAAEQCSCSEFGV